MTSVKYRVTNHKTIQYVQNSHMEIASSSAGGLASVRMACQVAKGLSTHCVEVKFHLFLISAPNGCEWLSWQPFAAVFFFSARNVVDSTTCWELQGREIYLKITVIPDLSVVFCSPGFSETSALVRYITRLKKQRTAQSAPRKT